MKKATKGLLRGVKRSLSVTCNIRCGHSGGGTPKGFHTCLRRDRFGLLTAERFLSVGRSYLYI